jgi:hypothetical protein
MRIRANTIRGVAAIAIAALTVAGCGSSPKPSASASGGTASAKVPGTAPGSGSFTTYKAGWFKLSVPAGWAVAKGTGATGKTSVAWESRSPRHANVSAVYGTVKAMGGSLDTAIAQLREYALRYQHQASVKVSDVSVDGATEARLVTIRGDAKSLGPQYALDLFVRSGGRQIEVIAQRFKGNDSFDPSPVIHSFKLTG